MKFCISFGKFELKFFFYCILIVILEFYIYNFIDYFKVKILEDHLLLNSSCLFLGYLLNIIPVWIRHIKSKKKENSKINKLKEENTQSIEYIFNKPDKNYLSSKEILIFCFISLFPLIEELLEHSLHKINDKDKESNYNDDFPIIEYSIIFLASKFDKEVYYKHQYISFFILILVEAIKNIYFLTKASIFNIFFIFKFALSIIYSILYPIYYLYIKNLMKYKFISPVKCNFMIGMINFPLTILIYFIISFTSLGIKDNNNYYFDNIFYLFEDIGNMDAKNIIILISLPLVYGILEFIIINIIYDYTIYHIYIPILIIYFVEYIIDELKIFDKFFLISIFLIELIMILILLEMIEINFCGLNKNLKRYIESRGIIDSSLNNENHDDDDYDKIDNERNDETTKL